VTVFYYVLEIMVRVERSEFAKNCHYF